MDATTCLQLRAPAKINLRLEVLGKRADGYHELRMLLVPVSLFDDVWLRPLPAADGIQLRCEGDAAVAGGEGNLCCRAARYYQECTDLGAGVDIRIRKRIPSGAGLGGGSSDAAATIAGLERLFRRPLSGQQRRAAAFRVGADVPFFFCRSAAWVEGIGEVVRPQTLTQPLWAVLVYPGISLGTAEVFSRFTMGLTSPGRLPTITQFSFQGIAEALANDLQAAALALEPAVGCALEVLAEGGSAVRLMSGSGTTVFGLFPEEISAQQTASFVRSHPRARQSWRVEVVHTLAAGAFPILDECEPDWGVDKR